jgi:DNA polymerase III gamma/tau subunit
MVINGYRVTAVPRTSGPMIGAVPGAGDAAQKLTETYYKSLSDVYAAGGEPVAKLRDTVSQLQNLSNIAQTNGIYGQWTTAMRAQAKALGFGDITNAQQAQTAMDNLLKTLIPELKSDYNLSRVAQPEIVLLGKVTGSADLTQPELANILANLRTGTDLSEALRSQAARALGLSSDQTPYDYPDYAKFENDSFNKYSQVAEQNRANFGAIGARLDNRKPPVQTPVQTPPDQSAPPVQTPPGPVQQQGAGNPILDFFGGLGHIFGGGNPPTTTPPDSRELVPGKDF